jgi:hypothetical protein
MQAGSQYEVNKVIYGRDVQPGACLLGGLWAEVPSLSDAANVMKGTHVPVGHGYT